MKRLTRIILPLLMLTLTACSGGDEGKVEKAEKAPPVSEKTAETAKAGDDTGKVWIRGWRKNPANMNTPRAGAAVALSGNHIYMIGGVDGKNFLTTTEYAEIHDDGSIGPWVIGPDLNMDRGFDEAAVWGDYIYIVGGANGQYGKNLLSSVERAKIEEDGSLGPWQIMDEELPVGIRCSKILLKGDDIYSLGGFSGVMLDTVTRSKIGSDGNPGPWRNEDTKMITPHYVNSVKVHNGNIYALGGHETSKGVGMRLVEFASLSESGEVGEWVQTSSLKKGRYGLTSAINNGHIYILGGITGAEYVKSIEKAKLNSDGTLGLWAYTTPLSSPRSTFSTVTHKGNIYVIGGSNREGYLSTTEYATFDKNGDIGYWGTPEEAKAADRAKAERENANTSGLPHKGHVVEVIQTSGYTYIQVSDGRDGRIWLAGPKMQLSAGAVVGFSDGVTMSNFHSKELDRTFDRILFVGTVRRINN